jgi:nicotinate dehydrogenase subunit B
MGCRAAACSPAAALVLSFSLLQPADLLAQEAQGAKPPPQEPKLPGSLKTEPMLDAWIRIDADGTVTVFTGKAELGQGIKTALIQVAAEQLEVDPGAVRFITADTSQTPNEGYTAGSHSMQDSGMAILHAAAQVRAILIGLAATRLDLPPDRLRARDGAVVAEDGRRLPYGELVADDVLHVRATPTSPLKDPARHAVIGQSVPRVDIPAKVTGGAAYVHDLRLSGMVHARVVRPPGPGARLRALDASAVERLPGVLKIVRDGDYLAVVAGREFQAVAAMRALAAAAQWDEQPSLPDQASLYSYLESLAADTHVILDRQGPPVAAVKTAEAAYRRPYQMHGSIGPSCAVALFQDGALTVWSHAQGMFPLRRSIAEMLGLAPEAVRCVHREGAGCYGHNGADDAAADAALIARALPGRPVRVQWMREQEHTGEPYGPAMLTKARASLDASGAIVDWRYEVRSNTHSTRPPGAGQLLPARLLAAPFQPSPPKPLPQPEGGGDRNAIPLYALPSARVVHEFVPAMPLRVSALRALGAYMNVFSIESFMDELAAAAGADPVAFRLRHLEDARARAVVTTAAERFDWSDAALPRGRGRGFAFARYKNLAAYAAIAAEVEVARESGRVRLVRAVAAVDSGEAVNPDGIRNQIEGGIIQSASWTLYEQATFDRTRITSKDWSTYPILRFVSAPESVAVHVIDRPGQPFLGTGEAAQGPAAAAIANAVAHATGARVRELPLTPERIRTAVGI